MSKKRIDALVFDMDGVLFDTETVSGRAWRRTAAEMNMQDSEAAVKGCTGMNHEGTRLFFLDKYGENFPFDDFMARSSAIFRAIIEEEGLNLMPGVLQALDYLKERNVPIALASSTSKGAVLHHLEYAHITSYFSAIITGDMVERGKPDPMIYQRAAEALGKESAYCMAIEDSPNGMRSAHAAGMLAVMIPDQIEPTAEIEQLAFDIQPSLLAWVNWMEEIADFSTCDC